MNLTTSTIALLSTLLFINSANAVIEFGEKPNENSSIKGGPRYNGGRVLKAKKDKKGKKVMEVQEMRRSGTFITAMNAAQNPTQCDSDALGNGIFTYKDGMLCAYLSYSGLKNGDVENRSHIHGPAAIGENYSDIVVTFYNRNTEGTEGELPGSNKSACYDLDAINEEKNYDYGTLESLLFDGLLLVNIHSDYCDKGEIRGQILPVG